jgi:hypothetical protein
VRTCTTNQGRSISFEDFAVAPVDELENRLISANGSLSGSERGDVTFGR